MGHPGAHLGDRPGSLMPQHHGRIDHERPDLAMGVVMHVRPAHAHSVDGDPDHARPDVQRQVDVTQGQLMLAFEDEGADFGHGRFPVLKKGTRHF
ncbi:hypothetical protein D3C72_1924270 [compost metagenome]